MSGKTPSKRKPTAAKAKKNTFGLELRLIKPKTITQEQVFEAFHQNHLFLMGFAGTGKSFCALYLSLREILENHSEFQRIIVIRSAVQARDMGFMPGNESEKMAYYEAPYEAIVNNLCGRADAYGILRQKGAIEFMSTSFLRGLTFDDAIIIVDEVQNMEERELDTIMTRVGENSKIIFCGDGRQTDFVRASDKAGLGKFLKIVERMKEIEIINFTVRDCVRSDFVKQFLIAKDAIEHEFCNTKTSKES